MALKESTQPSLDDGLAAFVSTHVGRITRYSKADLGSSRVTWLLETTAGPCVLREDTGDGPVAHTPLTLAREASVYARLADTNVRIPKLLASHERALLIEMADGVSELNSLAPDQRVEVMNSYVDALADLHLQNVDVGFEELSPPETPQDAAKRAVELWAGILSSRVKRPCPLATVTTRWLMRNAPLSCERLVVVHGDVGPGNFLHDGMQVTALLDWEFVRIGDPMDDLAQLAFRGHQLQSGIGDFDAQLARWSRRTGMKVDRRRIAYYRILVMYIWLVSSLSALDNGAKQQNRFTYLNLINALNVLIPRAVMAYEDRNAPEVEINHAVKEGELTEQLAALVDLIGLSLSADNPGGQHVQLMAKQIHRFAQIQESIDNQNRLAVERLLGTKCTENYDLDFTQWVERGSGDEASAFDVIYANGLRRIEPDLALKPLVETPLLEL